MKGNPTLPRDLSSTKIMFIAINACSLKVHLLRILMIPKQNKLAAVVYELFDYAM